MRLALMSLIVVASTLNGLAEIPWSSDLRSGHTRALAENKLLLVHFESDNCVWCERLEAGAFQSPDVQQAIGQSYVAVKINGSQNRQLAEYFKVNRFPTDVVVDTSGAVHCHSVSPQSPGQYIAMLEQALAKSSADSAATVASAKPAAPPVTQTQPTAAPVASQPYGLSPSGSQLEAPTVATAEPTPAAASVPAGSGFQMPSHVGGPLPGQNVSTGLAAPEPPLSNTASEPDPEPAPEATPVDPVANVQQNSGIPENITDNALAAEALTPQSPNLPPLAMDGYCAVSILEETKWIPGDKNFGAIHLGKLYLFSSQEAQDLFMDNPDKYTPALGGLDVVQFIQGRQEQEGSREYGLQHRGQLYFFASEESLKQFFLAPDDYSTQAGNIMRQATAGSRNLR